MSLYINSALVGASVQDDGRPGLQRYGVTSGGAVDKLALAQGRVLLNDEGNTAALEFSAVGGKFKVQTSSFFVFTGAEAPLKLNGNLIQQGQVFEAKAGDEIEIGSISNGFYGYDNCISDHRPVAIKLFQTPSNVEEENKAPSKLKGIRDIQGRKTLPQSNNLQFYYYENGTVEKHFIIN